MNNIEERIESLKANVALSDLIGPDELTVTVSDLSALIAQLEAAQKEITDWRSVAEAAAQDDADWHKLVDSKSDVISHLASGIINLIAQLEAAQLELIKPLPISELIHGLEGQTHKKWFSESDVKDLRERAEKAEAALSAANEKLDRYVILQGKTNAVAYRYKLKNNFCRWAYSDGIPPDRSDKFQEELLFTSIIKGLLELPDVESGKYWFEHDGRNLFDGVEFNNDVISAIKAAGFTVEGE